MTGIIFIFSGFIAVVGQTVLLREFFAVFQGSELSLGLVFSHWLLGGAAGSVLAGRLRIQKITHIRAALRLSFFATAVCLAAAFYFTRSARDLLHLVPGQALGFGSMAWVSFLITFPLGFFAGAQFPLGVRLVGDGSVPSGRVYALESFGYLAGGAVLTFALLSFLSPARIVFILIILCFIAVALLLERKLSAALSLLGASVLAVVLFPSLGMLEDATLARLYKGYRVTEKVNSPCGSIVVAERGGQSSLFYDGVPVLTVPHRPSEKLEIFGRVPLLFHPDPRRVLVIGGAGECIPALLDGPVQLVDYVESDPLLLEAVEKLRKSDPWQNTGSTLITMQYDDIHNVLKHSYQRYDVIYLCVPLPVTLAQNRFYTEEFFGLAAESLAPGGILAANVPGSLVYVDALLARVTAVTETTLRSAFASVLPLPTDYGTIFIASLSELPGSGEAVKRFARRGPQGTFLSKEYLAYLLDPAKAEWLRGQVKKYAAQENVRNRDFSPRALTASLAYSQSLFSSSASSFYRTLVRFSPLLWLGVLAWFVTGKVNFRGTAFTSGAASMGLQMISFWGLQAHGGYLYHWVGLMTAVFMAGLAAASSFAVRNAARFDVPRAITKAELAFCTWTVLWWLAIRYSLLSWPFFFVFSAGSGALLGFQFPLLAAGQAHREQTDEGVVAGGVYAADLLGGWAAAVIGGIVLIPAWGFERTILLLLVLKVISLRWWVKHSLSSSA